MAITYPELLASCMGVKLNSGEHSCFWCGADCDDRFVVKVSDTFWDWDAVAYPKSKYQCSGCCECLDEKRSIKGKANPQKTRNYSWLCANGKAVPLTKADLKLIRETCLNPPHGVWGLSIAESGQKHILFRSPVNSGRSETVAVQLELVSVSYTPGELRECILDCAKIVSATGKPALSGPLPPTAAFNFHQSSVDVGLIEKWNAVWNSPVWRLAAFLSPSKESCLEYLAENDTSRVPPASGGPEGREKQQCLFE